MTSFTEIREQYEKQLLEHSISGKHIIICEGPAGSGKTTLLKRLVDLPHCEVVSRSLQKRQFQTKEAGAKSFKNDLSKLSNALLEKSPIVFIDRCVISQMVYHAIRTNKNIPDRDINYDTQELLELLEYDLAWRLERKPRKISLSYLFLIPSSDALRERRLTGGKHYPNHWDLEIFHYKKAIASLLDYEAHLLSPAYNNLEDQDYIVHCFSEWVKEFPYVSFPSLWKSFAIGRSEFKNGK